MVIIPSFHALCEEDLFHVFDFESLQESIALAFDDTGGKHDLFDLFDKDSPFQC